MECHICGGETRCDYHMCEACIMANDEYGEEES